MSSKDICEKRYSTFTISNEFTKKFNNLLQEYEKIKRAYQETNDSLKMKFKAFEFLGKSSPDFEKAVKCMRLAVKIIKACNGVR
ncbi:MAG: hypothetical protein JXA54_04995 [Candidatus Heimdallarchaeota archaeon]|nr:hypothetical protein [Candidatus Heimdallarchaeota archaeon]